jgi:predicted NUDIX family NTP pyrophosphohydrolase
LLTFLMGKVEDKAFAQVLDRIFQEKVKRVKTIALDSAKQPGGKVVHVWAIEEDWDPADLQSNTFEMEWPPRSGRRQSFPELDRASWFGIAEARLKILNWANGHHQSQPTFATKSANRRHRAWDKPSPEVRLTL